jgi:hypothetical protein
MADPLLRWMKAHNVPVTREKYLALAYGEDLPDPWMPEHEAELPEELQSTVDDAVQLELWDYDPAQPRAPAGTSEGGQWTSGGAEPSPTPGAVPVFTTRGNEILRGGEVVGTIRYMTEGRVELTIEGKRLKFRNYQAALTHLARSTALPSPSGADKMLLVTHHPSDEQYAKWDAQIQAHRDKLEAEQRFGDREDSQVSYMRNALKEYRAAKPEDQASSRVGLSVVYGGPHDTDDPQLLAVTMVRFNEQQGVVRITSSGGLDEDAHIKSLQQIVARYGREGSKAERIEGAIWGDDLETAAIYEAAGFRITGETSVGMTRVVYGKEEPTKAEQEAAEKLALARRNEVEAKARVAAAQLDFNPDDVVFNDRDDTFILNGVQMHYAGSFTHGQAKIEIYHKHVALDSVAGVTAHEIGHRKLDALRQRYRDERADVTTEFKSHENVDTVMKPDGTLREPFATKYPVYQAWKTIVDGHLDEMRESDGVSDYSKEYWKAITAKYPGDTAMSKAFHETIAEMNRIKFETGKLPGSKRWQQLHQLMEKNWAQMRPLERELVQPKSEKEWW